MNYVSLYVSLTMLKRIKILSIEKLTQMLDFYLKVTSDINYVLERL